MPPKKQAKAKKGAAKGGRKSKKAVKNVPDFASLSETRTISTQGGFNTNTRYSLMNTSLEQFIRAPLVGQAYQHYRIKYVELRLKPTYDTFATGGTTKFHIYYMIDKAGAIPTNISLEGLKMMGAKPHSLDEKTFKIGWRPSVLEVALTQGGAAPLNQGSKYQISPWLNTSASAVNTPWTPSTVDHLGVYWYVEQLAGAQSPYQVEVEVQFEFKKPLITVATALTDAIPVSFAQLNNSNDGVVDDRPGGDDTLLPAPSS